MKKGVDKSGRHIYSGNKVEMDGVNDEGIPIVILRIDKFTRDFLKPTISLPYEVYPKSITLDKYRELKTLVRSYGLGEEYDVAFAILIHAIQNSTRKNRISKIKNPDKVNELIKRFNTGEFPKSITVRYAKTKSCTLPPEMIAVFWGAFVSLYKTPIDAEVNKIEIEKEVSKVVYQLVNIKKGTLNQLISALIRFASGSSVKDIFKIVHKDSDMIRKRIKNRSGQNRK